jgi:hypothetical protein
MYNSYSNSLTQKYKCGYIHSATIDGNEVIVFDKIKDAEEMLNIKNKIMGADFYKIVPIK